MLEVEGKEVREISLAEVSLHDSFEDCWIVLYNQVYNITEFLQQHPGGMEILGEQAGRDGTVAYQEAGHSPATLSVISHLLIGVLPESESLYTRLFSSFLWKPIQNIF